MARLEDGDYATRLPTPKVKELAVLTNRFNTLAGALDVAREENSGLYRQLISVQEEERREIANELHDEAGPCLFGITANASSIQNIVDQLPDPRAPRDQASRRRDSWHRRAAEADEPRAAQEAQAWLARPRRLAELIDELIAGFERRHPGTHILYSARPACQILWRAHRPHALSLHPGRHHQRHSPWLGRAISRSTSPRKAGIAATGQAAAAKLRLIIGDDGKGIAPATPKGFGLTTMTERVTSLGGTCAIEGAPAKGTTIHVEIPVQRDKRRTPRALELVGEMS